MLSLHAKLTVFTNEKPITQAKGIKYGHISQVFTDNGRLLLNREGRCYCLTLVPLRNSDRTEAAAFMYLLAELQRG